MRLAVIGVCRSCSSGLGAITQKINAFNGAPYWEDDAILDENGYPVRYTENPTLPALPPPEPVYAYGQSTSTGYAMRQRVNGRVNDVDGITSAEPVEVQMPGGNWVLWNSSMGTDARYQAQAWREKPESFGAGLVQTFVEGGPFVAGAAGLFSGAIGDFIGNLFSSSPETVASQVPSWSGMDAEFPGGGSGTIPGTVPVSEIFSPPLTVETYTPPAPEPVPEPSWSGMDAEFPGGGSGTVNTGTPWSLPNVPAVSLPSASGINLPNASESKQLLDFSKMLNSLFSTSSPAVAVNARGTVPASTTVYYGGAIAPAAPPSSGGLLDALSKNSSAILAIVAVVGLLTSKG